MFILQKSVSELVCFVLGWVAETALANPEPSRFFVINTTLKPDWKTLEQRLKQFSPEDLLVIYERKYNLPNLSKYQRIKLKEAGKK